MNGRVNLSIYKPSESFLLLMLSKVLFLNSFHYQVIYTGLKIIWKKQDNMLFRIKSLYNSKQSEITQSSVKISQSKTNIEYLYN